MIIGTAGHIDHGKTSLVRALTGVETDRLKEEKARGITIDLGFAYLAGPGETVLGFVDVPGHERFVHTMVAGASGIDFVLLVVAADDGMMPQTAEHLAIIELLGVRRGAVALTKCDLVEPARLAQVEAQLRAALAATALAEIEIVPVSTVTGAGVETLRDLLFAAAREEGVRDSATGRFRLAVDRSFTLTGAGTVVTGTVLSGEAATGDRVLVSPRALPARIRSIHAQNRPAERGVAGQRCALNLAGEGISKDAVARGDVVLAPSLHAPSARIDAELRILGSERRPIGTWFPVRLHHAAAEVGARLVPLGDPLAPGCSGWVQLVLDRPIAAAAGDRFVIRDTSAQRTIGGGRFIDLRAPARKRRSPERLAHLAAAAIPDPAAAVLALLAVEPGYLDLDAFARDRALGPDAAAAIVAQLGLLRIAAGERAIVLEQGRWRRLQDDLAAALGRFHAENPDVQGIGLERLRLMLPLRLPALFFRSALQRLAVKGVLALSGSWIRLPTHEVRLGDSETALWATIAPLLGGGERFRPPRVRDLAGSLGVAETEVRRVMKLIGRRGDLDEVAHDHFFLRSTVAEMAVIVRELSAGAPDGFFTSAQFRDRVENGRKVAIQILDFFDRHGVTLRRGDLRKINPHRLDLFASPGLGTGTG